jgi:hypothetical protein
VGDAVLVRPPGADKAPPELAAYLTKAGQLTAKNQNFGLPQLPGRRRGRRR